MIAEWGEAAQKKNMDKCLCELWTGSNPDRKKQSKGHGNVGLGDNQLGGG